MSVIAFTPDANSPGKKDYSGAFKPEAQRFCSLFTGRRFEVPSAASARHQERFVLETIRVVGENETVDSVAFFCHGFQRRIQLGFSTFNVGALAKALAEVRCDRVALYACSSGSGPGPGGDNGFADRLRDEMCKAGLVHCRVLAHVVAGHTTMNRYKRFFDGMGSPVGGTGGYEIVTSSSPLWPAWSRRIRDLTDPLRFRLPSMSIAEIHKELSA